MTVATEPQRRREWPYLAALSTAVLLAVGFVTHASCAPGNAVHTRAPEVLPTASSTHSRATSTPADAAHPASPQSVRAGLSTTDPPTANSRGAQSRGAPSGADFTDAPLSVAGNTRAPHVDPRELPLLANIERELKRDPPPQVHALLAEYRRGETRSALIEYVQRRFPKDLPLRALTLRWIDDVRPSSGAPHGAGISSSAPPSGPGWVAPIETHKR